MAQLFEVQPDGDPIDYTHWDCWNVNPFDINADQDRIADELQGVVACWEKSTDRVLDDFITEMYDGYREAVFMLGFGMVMDILVFNVLRAGFDVYYGEEFIEIYKGEDDA